MDGAMMECIKFHFEQYLFFFFPPIWRIWNGTNFFFKS